MPKKQTLEQSLASIASTQKQELALKHNIYTLLQSTHELNKSIYYLAKDRHNARENKNVSRGYALGYGDAREAVLSWTVLEKIKYICFGKIPSRYANAIKGTDI